MLPTGLRIAHLTPAFFSPDSYVGGGERYVDYVVKALRLVGDFQQCIFTLGKDDEFFARAGVPVRVLRNESPMPEQPNGFSAALWHELRGFDLVHLHQSLTVFGAYSLCILRSMGIPVIGTDLGGGQNSLMLRGRGVELLDGSVSISHYAYSLIERYYSGPHEVIIGPVDTDYFKPDRTVARNPRAILCVSRIMPHKGIDRVISALPKELSLTVVGKVYHEEYYALLQKMAENKAVRFITSADDSDLLTLYQSSSLFVQASTSQDIYGNRVGNSELMGLTTLEAMATGLPAVVSDAGSLPELVPDPRFGLVFHDHAELTAILDRFAKDEWPTAGVESVARAHVIDNHGMEVTAHRLARFYRSIVVDKSKHGLA